MKPDLLYLTALASRFRAAMEACDKAELPIQFEQFPAGACGDTTYLLAKYLKEHGIEGFVYVHGRRNRSTHAWLQQEDLIVDITADQFPDMMDSVFVQCESSWHATFSVEETHTADYEEYDRQTRDSLTKTYNTVLRYLKE